MAKREYIGLLAGGLLMAGCQATEGPTLYATGGANNHQTADGPSPPSDAGMELAMTDGNGSDGVPSTWQEHWFEHVQLIKKVDSDENFVLYFDNDMDPVSARWISPYLSALWKYTKAT